MMTNNPVQEFLSHETARGFLRRPLMPELQRIRAAASLANPHGKFTRAARKALHHLRSFIRVPVEPQQAIPFPVKFARRLTTLSMAQLIRRQRKFAREASTAKHLLAKLLPGPSRIRSMLQARHDEHLSCFKQVNAEITARILAVQGRLAAAE